MPAAAGSSLIEGRIARKTSNALKLTFQDGAGESVGEAIQGGADGKGAKFATLLGFKNGGPGRHRLTYPDGSTLLVTSRERQPTLIARGDGVELATINRGPTSTAVLAGGGELLGFVADPGGAVTGDLFRLLVTAPGGSPFGRLDVIRSDAGWKTLRDVFDSAWEQYVFWDRAHLNLPIPILGTSLLLDRPVSDIERDVLLAACVDIAVGMRPYIAEMN
jgi:hypothetical protein